jgi:hypothetical protein
MVTTADTANHRRSVEALAQALYEASDPTGVRWARRARVIREPWLALAEAQIAKGEQSPPAKATA